MGAGACHVLLPQRVVPSSRLQLQIGIATSNFLQPRIAFFLSIPPPSIIPWQPSISRLPAVDRMWIACPPREHWQAAFLPSCLTLSHSIRCWMTTDDDCDASPLVALLVTRDPLCLSLEELGAAARRCAHLRSAHCAPGSQWWFLPDSGPALEMTYPCWLAASPNGLA